MLTSGKEISGDGMIERVMEEIIRGYNVEKTTLL